MTQSSVQLVDPDPPIWTETSCIQLGYGAWVNLSVVGTGLALGFSAVAIPQLKDPNSPIVITMKEEAMIASVLTLFSPIGNCVSGVIMDRFGRKIALILSEIPLAIGWFYMGFARNPLDIIIGRIITGIGMGMKIIPPRAYVTEITLPNMRGVIGALPSLSTSIGLVFQATLGTYMHWMILCHICGVYALILMFAYIFLPDTPYSVLLKSSASKAKLVLKKFRSKTYNLDAEINELKDFKDVNDIRRLGLMETLKALFKPASCKPFAIVLFYVLLMQFVGANVVIMWAVEMLQDSKSSIDPHLGNVILAVTRVIVGIITSILLYKVPRRVLAMISAIGLGMTCMGLGFYLKTHDYESPYPLVLFVFYISFATLGYYTLPFLMMFELLPLQVRGILSGLAFSTMSLSMFGVNQIYPTMRSKIGLGYTIIVYGTISLGGAVVLYFILPETKDLTLQEIEEYFNDIRPTLVSQRQVMSMQLQAFSKRSLDRFKQYTSDRLRSIPENTHTDKHHDREKKHGREHRRKHDRKSTKDSASVVIKDSAENRESKN